jgi:hypothetical protein
MIRLLVTFHLLLFLGCGAPSKHPKTIIGDNEPEETTTIPLETDQDPMIIESVLPKGAVVGNFNGNLEPFFAHISKIDRTNAITYISFEDEKLPQISIPLSLGGTVSKQSLEGFDRDLLLFTAKLKDPNFNKYFLYVLRDNRWKPVMNGFAIHLANLSTIDEPLKLNPNNPNELNRYYSVFNLDSSSPLGYTWLLLEENVPIENR